VGHSRSQAATVVGVFTSTRRAEVDSSLPRASPSARSRRAARLNSALGSRRKRRGPPSTCLAPGSRQPARPEPRTAAFFQENGLGEEAQARGRRCGLVQGDAAAAAVQGEALQRCRGRQGEVEARPGSLRDKRWFGGKPHPAFLSPLPPPFPDPCRDPPSTGPRCLFQRPGRRHSAQLLPRSRAPRPRRAPPVPQEERTGRGAGGPQDGRQRGAQSEVRSRRPDDDVRAAAGRGQRGGRGRARPGGGHGVVGRRIFRSCADAAA